MEEQIGFAEIALAALVVKEAFAVVRAAVTALTKKGNSNHNPQGMNAECRGRFDRLDGKVDRIETSVVAPDRQPLHVTLRSVLGLVSKEA